MIYRVQAKADGVEIVLIWYSKRDSHAGSSISYHNQKEFATEADER
jgi:hypothetical protein